MKKITTIIEIMNACVMNGALRYALLFVCCVVTNLLFAQNSSEILVPQATNNTVIENNDNRVIRFQLHMEINPDSTKCIHAVYGVTRAQFEAHIIKYKANKAQKTQIATTTQSSTITANSRLLTCGSFLNPGVIQYGDISQGVISPLANVGCPPPMGAYNVPSLYPRYQVYRAKTGQNGEIYIDIDDVSPTLDPAFYFWDGCGANANFLGLCLDSGGGLGDPEYGVGSGFPACTEYVIQVKHWRRSQSGSTLNCSSCTYSITADIDAVCIPCNLSLTTSTTPAVNGSNNGTATVTATGGSGNYGYVWDDGYTSQTDIDLSAGVYKVTVTDNTTGCTKTASATVTSSGGGGGCNMSVTGTANNATVGNADGSAHVTITGGSGSYTTAWSNGGTGTDIFSLPQGAYTVTVTDNNTANCTRSYTVTVGVSGSGCNLTATSTQLQQTLPNQSTGSAIVNASGGASPYTYHWDNNQTNQISINMGDGRFYVTVTDVNGCTATASGDITIGSAPCTLTATPGSSPATCGASNGSVWVNTSGGTVPYTYLWSPTGEATATVQNRPAGVYTVTVTDAGGICTIAVTVVMGSTNPSYTAITCANTQICSGGSTLLSAGAGSGAQTYQWSNGVSGNSIIVTNTGTYTVTATDIYGCVATATIAITTSPPPPLTIAASATAVCLGSSVLLNANTPAPNTVWSDNSINTSLSVSPTATTTYSVTVTDAGGCTATAQQIIVVNPLPTLAFNPPNPHICSDTTTLITAVSATATDYIWQAGSITSDITVSTIGIYTVTVTDANGCTVSNTVTVTNASAAQPDFIPTVVAHDATFGSNTILLHQPYGFTWYPNDPFATNAANQNSVDIILTHNYSETGTFYPQLLERVCVIKTTTKEVEIGTPTMLSSAPFANIYTLDSSQSINVVKILPTRKGILVLGNAVVTNARTATVANKVILAMVAPDGKYLYGTSFYKSGTATGLADAGNDKYVICFSSHGKRIMKRVTLLGNEQWAVGYTGAPEQPIVLVGSRNIQGTYTDAQGTTHIIQTDNLGNLISDKKINFNTYPIQQSDAYSMPDGGSLLVGSSINGTSALAVRFDANMNIIWKKSIGGGTGVNFLKVCLNSGGQVVIGGVVSNSQTNTQTMLLVLDAANGSWVNSKLLDNETTLSDLKLNGTTLLVTTNKSFFGIADDLANVIVGKSVLVPNMVFQTTSINTTNNEASFVFKPTTSGTASMLITNVYLNQANICTISNANTRLVNSSIGLTSNTQISLTTAPTPSSSPFESGSVALFLQQSAYCTVTTNTEYAPKVEFTISPNPTTGIFTVQIDAVEQSTLLISNALGQIIQQQSITSSRVELNLSEQPPGVYFLKIQTAEGEMTKKLILQK